MCGICGVVSFARPLRASDGYKMVDSLAHRGPDGQGLYADGYGRVRDRGSAESLSSRALLGHTRLSIIDLSNLASQPMANSDGSTWITYNGEIFNFVELRSRLSALGHGFSTQSDTEVILKAYEEYGPACIDHLRGMFTFAIWDERNGRLFIARDRLGIKPLYYYEGKEIFAFASEVRALARLEAVPKDLAIENVLEFLHLGHVPSPTTIWEHVYCVPPGSTISIDETGLNSEKYWALDFKTEDDSHEGSTLEDFKALLPEAFGLHMVSDRPVGLFLSGGIDSTAVLSVVSKLREGAIDTFSLTFPGCEEDESRTARVAANTYGSNHHEWAIQDKEVEPLFSEFLSGMDQPSIDGFNTYLASRFSRDHGVPVALSGLGGDELFAGYDGFRRIPKWLKIRQLARVLPGSLVRTAARAFLPFNNTNVDKACQILLAKPVVSEQYDVYRSVLSCTRLQSLMNPDFVHAADISRQRRLQLIAGTHFKGEREQFEGVADIYQMISYLELTKYMQDRLLRDTDVCSMSCGIEVRVPILDHVLVERIWKIPSAMRNDSPSPKQLLISAAGDIPEPILGGKKKGFMLPMHKWMQTVMAPAIDETLYNPPENYFQKNQVRQFYEAFRNGRAIHWSRVLSLYILCRWLQTTVAN